MRVLEFREEHTHTHTRVLQKCGLFTQFLLYGLVERDKLDNFPETSLLREIIVKTLGSLPFFYLHSSPVSVLFFIV